MIADSRSPITPIDVNRLTDAIVLHKQWKQRLQGALMIGRSAYTVAEVSDSENCELGVWLNALPVNIKATDQWKLVKKIHREFHECAALVLDLTLKGHQSEAAVLLEPGGLFSESEVNLTNALMQWKNRLTGGF